MDIPHLLHFPKITDPRGNLTFIQNFDTIPFEIKRVFWIYDVPGGEVRGGHAYKTQQEIIIALTGSFDIIVVGLDGKEHKFNLNRSYFGLYIPKNHWRHMENFSTNAVALHLSTDAFNEEDYIRDFEQFKQLPV